jgi:transcriptional regulator with XRE-family HTH domain
MKKPRPPSPRSANSIDKHFGDQIRNRRQAINMTQDHLGQGLGVSFQQIQKYESGKNRISAARLYAICHVLDVPIASMFKDIPRNAPKPKKNGHTAARSKKNPPA